MPRETDDRFRKMFEEGPLGMAIVGLDYRFEQVNRRLCELLGYTEQELTALTVPDVIHPDDLDTDVHLAGQMFRGDIPYYTLEKRHMKNNGEILWINLTVSVVRDAGGTFRYGLALIEDITDRKLAAQELIRLRAIVESTTDFIGFAAPDRRILYINRAGRNMIGLESDADLAGLRLPDAHPEWTNRLLESEALPTAAREGSWAGEAAFVDRQGREIPASMVVLGHKAPDGNVEFFSTISRDITERKRAEEDRERRRKEAESLAEIGRLLTESLELREVAQRITDSARALLGARVVTLWQKDSRSMSLVMLTFSGELIPEMQPGMVLPAGTGAGGLAVRERRPVVTADLFADPRIIFTPEVRAQVERAPYRSNVAIPLVVQGEVIGSLSVGDRAGRVFTDAEVAVLERFADHAAIAMQNARLYEETQTTLARRTRLIRLGHAVASSLNFQQVLDSVTEAALDLLAVDLAHLWVVDEADRVVRLMAVKGSHGDSASLAPSAQLPLGQGLVGWVVAQKRKRYSLNILEDPLLVHRDWARASGHVSQLAIPLIIDQRCLGALIVLTKVPREFTAEDEWLLELFASQATTAVENARLYGTLHEAYEELSRTQAQLVQAQKMEAIGRLAGGIAHDFNNLLTVIDGRCQLVLHHLEPGHPLRRHVELATHTAERAGTLTRQLLAFSRKQVLQPQVVDVNDIVSRMVPMLQTLTSEDIELVTRLDPAIGRVKADRGQIEQVIVNLAVNAGDAMPQGGRLTIETTNAELDPAFVRENPGATAGSKVMLVVSDTGLGMSPDVQAHLFEPFFTTKEVGKGTGLGLATVYTIIKQNSGYIGIQSETGRGTRCEITLPRVDAGAESPDAEKAAPASPRGSETILMVEDEPGVRDLALEILREQGYAVLEAQHPGEALLIAERHQGVIHLLLTDVVMPHMSGWELAERVSTMRSGIKALCMSGYTAGVSARPKIQGPERAFIQKPFTPDGLARKVRDVLDAPGEGAPTQSAG